MGPLFAGLVAVASPPASGSTGCAGYVKPLNRAESFWRQARVDRVRVCIAEFGAASSGTTQNLTPLHLAAWFSGNPAVIAVLLKGGADPNARTKKGFTPLMVAAQHNRSAAMIAALLKGGAEPNARTKKGTTPLHLVVWFSGNPAVIAALLKGGADPNARKDNGFTPLMAAVEENRSAAMIAALLKGGADPNARAKNGATPLHLAALKSSSPAVVAALLKGGAQPNAKNAEGAAALHLAAKFNAESTIVVALLKGGADPNARSKKGFTPLMAAVEANRSAAMIAALLKGGGDPNARNTESAAALHLAAYYDRDAAILDALLKGGAGPNAKANNGASPLHLAALKSSSPAVVEALLKGGADPKARARGKTAFDLARKNRHLTGSDAYRRLREAHDAQAKPDPPRSEAGLTKEDYRAIQRLLNEKGFPAGPADGRWGSKSRSALRAFQAQAGLGQTGVPDKATRKALGFGKTAETATRDEESAARDDVSWRGVCGVGQELKPGQGCRIPGGGEFSVASDGCVKDIPDIPGPLSIGSMSASFSKGKSAICIRGRVGKGKFSARYEAEKSVWRIEALP